MKTVLISGASSGIGRYCAVALAKRGFRVLAGVRREQDAFEIEKAGSGRIQPVMLDVTRPDTIGQVFEEANRGTLHGLVNSAGVAHLGPMEFVPLDEIRHQFEVNVFGQIAMIQAFLPLLRKTTGRIINVSSISGRVAFPFAGPYAGSKYALEAVSDSLRRELGPWKIKVCLIEPGNIQTAIWEKSWRASREAAERFPPEVKEYYVKWLLGLGRPRTFASDPDPVAQAVVHALTARRPKTRYLVGRDARAYSLLSRLLPDWLLDRAVG